MAKLVCPMCVEGSVNSRQRLLTSQWGDCQKTADLSRRKTALGAAQEADKAATQAASASRQQSQGAKQLQVAIEEIASIAAEECFWDLDGPIHRITTPHIPLPAADTLEDLVLPNEQRIAEIVRRCLGG